MEGTFIITGTLSLVCDSAVAPLPVLIIHSTYGTCWITFSVRSRESVTLSVQAAELE